MKHISQIQTEFVKAAFAIRTIFTDNEGKKSIHDSVRVIDDKDMIDPNKKVIDNERIKINFDYPLSHEVQKTFKSQDGFTNHDFWEAVNKGYNKIYDEENAAVGDPGTIGENSPPGSPSSSMLNRDRSYGPHGIWGHIIDDLFIEDIVKNSIGEYDLTMGS